jgi:hypothetical protein
MPVLEHDLTQDIGYDRNASPMVVTLVSFLHFAVFRRQTLTPSVAFTSVRLLLFTMSKWLLRLDGVYTVVAGRW